MSRPERFNETKISSGSGASSLYIPQMRAARNTAEVAGSVIGAEWVDCPYEILYGPCGLLLSGLGIPLPKYMSLEDLRIGLPYEHAEAIRWSYLAQCGLGSRGQIKTRIREVRIERTHTAVAFDCVPYECAHWRALYEAASDSPVMQLGPKPTPPDTPTS